jgi:hypothetical protein
VLRWERSPGAAGWPVRANGQGVQMVRASGYKQGVL